MSYKLKKRPITIMTTEIDKLVSSLQREITSLSSDSPKDSIRTITEQLQELCSKLSANQDKLSEQTQHTFRVLESSLTSSTTAPAIQALAQSSQLIDLFQTAVYLSDPAHTSSQKTSPTVLQAIASYHHPLRIVPPKPLRSNPLNKEQVKLWIAAHPAPLREALRASINAITHISQEEFEVAFSASIRSFNQQIETDLKSKGKGTDQHYVALTWKHKSQEWMLEMALPQLSILPREVLNFEKFQEETAWFIKKNISLKRIAIFDDGLYSGAQIRFVMSDIINVCFALKLPIPKFYIICPFITEEGHKFIEEFAKLLQLSITFSEHQPIPSFQTRIEEQPEGQKFWRILMRLGLSNHPYLKTLSSYWFDHKIPDGASFPIFLADGLVSNLKGEITIQNDKPVQFQLIPQTQPPYHLF